MSVESLRDQAKRMLAQWAEDYAALEARGPHQMQSIQELGMTEGRAGKNPLGRVVWGRGEDGKSRRIIDIQPRESAHGVNTPDFRTNGITLREFSRESSQTHRIMKHIRDIDPLYHAALMRWTEAPSQAEAAKGGGVSRPTQEKNFEGGLGVFMSCLRLNITP